MPFSCFVFLPEVAPTDVSFTGRAGRVLALSRRNKRRAEERRNDKSRDCKFGSHQKVSWVTGDGVQTLGRRLSSGGRHHSANFIFLCRDRTTSGLPAARYSWTNV